MTFVGYTDGAFLWFNRHRMRSVSVSLFDVLAIIRTEFLVKGYESRHRDSVGLTNFYACTSR